MFLPQRRYHHILGSTDGLTVLPRIEIVTILVKYQPSYDTSHTMKVHYETQWPTAAHRCHNLHWRMYPACKVDISQHLAIPGFPQSDHTVGKPSLDAGLLCSEAEHTSWPQVLLKYQPSNDLDYRSAQKDPASWFNIKTAVSIKRTRNSWILKSQQSQTSQNLWSGFIKRVNRRPFM